MLSYQFSPLLPSPNPVCPSVVYLSILLSGCPFICQSVCLSIYPTGCLSVCPFTQLFDKNVAKKVVITARPRLHGNPTSWRAIQNLQNAAHLCRFSQILEFGESAAPFSQLSSWAVYFWPRLA